MGIGTKLFKVSVVGASGLAGGEVLRILLKHPNVEITELMAYKTAGTRIINHHQHLFALGERTLEHVDIKKLSNNDVVFLALPHGKSGEITTELRKLAPDILIVDLGADHRLDRAEDWDKFYGSEFLDPYTYGLPELPGIRTILKTTREIAVPGCNVTAITLALLPGILAHAFELDDIVAVLANGYSGAGKTLREDLLATNAINTAKPYQTGGIHRHVPEIRQNIAKLAGLGINNYGNVQVNFTPILVPMTRGILATCSVKPTSSICAKKLREIYEEFYENEFFVKVLPPQINASTGSVSGTNTALIQLAHDIASGRITIIAAIDNLVRGTAGQAVQSMNIALGLDEVTGLDNL
jgi:N-acetyl-gamma-glutamyl-phosphate reductase